LQNWTLHLDQRANRNQNYIPRLCLSVEYEDRSQELGSGRILFWMKELDELKEAHSVPLQKKKEKEKEKPEEALSNSSTSRK